MLASELSSLGCRSSEIFSKSFCYQLCYRNVQWSSYSSRHNILRSSILEQPMLSWWTTPLSTSAVCFGCTGIGMCHPHGNRCLAKALDSSVNLDTSRDRRWPPEGKWRHHSWRRQFRIAPHRGGVELSVLNKVRVGSHGGEEAVGLIRFMMGTNSIA